MAEREEIEEYEDEPRPVRVSAYAPLTAHEHKLHERQLADAEAEEVEEQLADDIEDLAARRAGYQSPYSAPGVPLSPQQAERERALDDAAARRAAADDDEHGLADDAEQLPPRRRGAVPGRVHGTWARGELQAEYEEWVHAQGLRGGPEAHKRFLAERGLADAPAGDDDETRADDVERAAAPRPAPVAPTASEQPRHQTDDDEDDETDDREVGTLRRVGKASAVAVGGALADLNRRVGDDAEREERPREREEVAGWLDADQGALTAWRSQAGWGFDEWLAAEERSGASGASGWL